MYDQGRGVLQDYACMASTTAATIPATLSKQTLCVVVVWSESVAGIVAAVEGGKDRFGQPVRGPV
jgi:hypothetical protein